METRDYKIVFASVGATLGVVVIVVVILHLFSFEIVYDPEVITNWDAVSGVAAWAGVGVGALIPLVVVWFQHKLDENKNDIKISNLELYKKIEKIDQQLQENNKSEQTCVSDSPTDMVDKYSVKILEYIGVAMEATTIDIAQHCNIPPSLAIRILNKLNANGQIYRIGTKSKNYWKIRR